MPILDICKMSGGKFLYVQRHHEWDSMLEKLDEILNSQSSEYNEAALRDLIVAKYVIRVGLLYAEQFDLLLSGDISDETFSKNLREQTKEIIDNYRPIHI
jgi:hypothetical protein